MRKVIESTLVSLDGVIGDPITWINGYFGKQAQEVALAQLLVSDALLMGRHTYEMFAASSDAGTSAYSERMKSIRKYVFSSTLERADWNNSVIIRGNVADAVSRLKQEDGQDLVFYGHGTLGQTLLEHHLLDELRLWIHPPPRWLRQAFVSAERKDDPETGRDEATRARRRRSHLPTWCGLIRGILVEVR